MTDVDVDEAIKLIFQKLKENKNRILNEEKIMRRKNELIEIDSKRKSMRNLFSNFLFCWIYSNFYLKIKRMFNVKCSRGKGHWRYGRIKQSVVDFENGQSKASVYETRLAKWFGSKFGSYTNNEQWTKSSSIVRKKEATRRKNSKANKSS